MGKELLFWGLISIIFLFLALLLFIWDESFAIIFQIRKMDLEARSLQPNVKAVLLARLREYKSDLNNLKNEVKRLVFGNANAAARDELLESGMADALTVCVNQAILKPFIM